MISSAISHVHIRSLHPHASAAWYEKHFDAKKVFDAEVTPGSITVVMQLGGPVTFNISSQPEGASREIAVAWLNRLGLEHFGFNLENLKETLEALETEGVHIVQPYTDVPGITWQTYIEGPDGVLIKVDPARDSLVVLKTYPNSEINDVRVTSDGAVMAVGQIDRIPWVGRFDLNADTIWTEFLPLFTSGCRFGCSSSAVQSVSETEDGRVVVAGFTREQPPLDGIGSLRDEAWFYDYFSAENPQSILPSRLKKEFQMPSYANLKEVERRLLASYLASLKVKDWYLEETKKMEYEKLTGKSYTP